MFKRKGKRNIHLMQPVQLFSAWLLLLLYLTGNVQVETFHKVFHAFEQAPHTSDQEKDPCHRAIYHDAKQKGCDHKTHVTAVKKCPLCHIIPLKEKHMGMNYVFESFSSPADFSDFSILAILVEISPNLSARAPPIC